VSDRDEGRAVCGSPLTTRASRDGSRVAMATLGEGLLEVGITPGSDPTHLERGFGGDAANVAVMAARMGVRSYLITHVGDDAAGRLLMRFWAERGVDVSHVSVDAEAPTGLYINERLVSGAHAFEYYRSGSAASRLAPADLDTDFLGRLDLLHVTGITLSISETSATAARAAADAARAGGAKIAFDLNYRPQLGGDAGELLAFARSADVVLLSHDDAEAMIGTSEARAVLETLGSGPREVILTRGAEPVSLFTAERNYRLRPPAVAVVNAAGAGDALAGTYLASRLSGTAPGAALILAVVAASASCGRAGCARGYPSAEEVEEGARHLTAALDTATEQSLPG
jgi:2-dehydro-3-deoxygluconokinase